jgi:hypothetical protein
MPETKTRATDIAVNDFLAAAPAPQKRADSATLIGLMQAATGAAPRMWGPSIIGFGRYSYRYESGHGGEACIVGFSPRKAEFSIYLNGTFEPEVEPLRAALLEKLGPHRMGKGCLYLKRLAGIDLAVLDELVRLSVATIRARWPDPAS